ncbi:NADPH-dependent 7-cyano-7-deazaguanine reductase QueF [bacterium]|nr:NADPH-dependent 7-cyano-7-deazaguanine reductase QueF [candidate division CSSED10-310 bacterium]
MVGKRAFNLKADPPDSIRTDLLETFPYRGETQQIRYETNEFSAVCPFSGLPDMGRIIIDYIPSGSCIELKSLKLYLVSFRSVGIFQEHATNRIFQDIWTLLEPAWLKIRTVYATRGGIDATCTVEKGAPPRD